MTGLLRRSARTIAACALLPFLALLTAGIANAQEGDPAAADEAFEEARELRREANTAGVEAQRRVDQLSNETDTLLARYTAALKQIDSIRTYNDQMRGLIGHQEAELASLAEQLDRVEVVGRSVSPLMIRMIDALGRLIEVDIPFLLDERRERVESLRELMGRADVTTAEKFRRIMEAYQIENEFGRTIEAYRDTLERDGREIQVDLLRFGRIALVYQTLDGSESGVWNQQEGRWQRLDDDYRTAIRNGLRIARKQAAPDLIRLPLPAAEKVDG